MKEIGSEFWDIDINNNKNNLQYFNIGNDNIFLMSGTTAIDFVLQDIKDIKKIVYMPDYCCEAMVKPFIDNNYQILYYHVDLINKKYYIDTTIDCSIFFAMSYFGYESTNMDNYIKEFVKNKKIIIEDITHRLFCRKNYCEKSTYLIASLRKWFPIYTGGLAVKMYNNFNVDLSTYSIDNELVNTKKMAMKIKRAYIENKINNKDEFLSLFLKSNDLIIKYQKKLIDKESMNILSSINIPKIFDKRVNNVKSVENILLKNNIPLLLKLTEDDCPLFVPLLLDNRDKIKDNLKGENIYCPIHWPNIFNINNLIYYKELSLICDQRYSQDDIIQYINKLIFIINKESNL